MPSPILNAFSRQRIVPSPVRSMQQLRKASNRIIGRFSQLHGCWLYGEPSFPPTPSAWITAETLFALMSAGMLLVHDLIAQRALDYLESSVVTDTQGRVGWTFHVHVRRPWVEATAWAIRALNLGRPDSPQLIAGVRWLLRAQRSDGGCGAVIEQDSRTYPTAIFIIALNELLQNSIIRANHALVAEITTARDNAIAWLVNGYYVDAGLWKTSANGDLNYASTGHAIFALVSIRSDSHTADQFLQLQGPTIVSALRNGLLADHWEMTVENHLALDDAATIAQPRSVVHRAMWNATSFCLFGLVHLCQENNTLGDCLAEVGVCLEFLINGLDRTGRRQFIYETTQAIWVIAHVSPIIENEIVFRNLNIVAKSRLLVTVLPGYVSASFSITICIALYCISILGFMNEKLAARTLLMGTSLLSLSVMHAALFGKHFGFRNLIGRPLRALVYFCQLAVVTIAAFLLSDFVSSDPTWRTIMAVVGVVSLLLLGSYVDQLVDSVLHDRNTES